MKIIPEKDLINSNEYVREPVDKEVNNILESDSNRFILASSKGTGKSVVLSELEKRGLGSKNQTIYMHPDSIRLFPKEPDGIYDENVHSYKYELDFTNNILNYIKRNYPITFEKHFKRDSEFVNSLLNNMYEQYNDFSSDNKIQVEFGTKQLSTNIITRFIDIMDLDKLNIAIDDFDKINGSSKYAEETFKEYFSLFDKVIIATTDSKIDKDRLTKEGYDIRKITYGKNRDALREIIKRRVNLINDEYGQKIDKELLTKDFIINKLTKLGGNIDLSLECIFHIRNLLKWYEGSNLENAVEKTIEEQKDNAKKLEKKYPKTTLYL